MSLGQPDIFNTDQGSQFTSQSFTGLLLEHDIKVSMDGKGRCMDNVFVERLWRNVKYEEVYLKAYQKVPEDRAAIGEYLHLYNHERPHQPLGYQTPLQVFEARHTGRCMQGSGSGIIIKSGASTTANSYQRHRRRLS